MSLMEELIISIVFILMVIGGVVFLIMNPEMTEEIINVLF